MNQVKKLDTVYVLFKKAKKSKRTIYTENFREYFFYLNSNKNNQQEKLIFSKPDRKNSYTDKNHPIIDTRIENKSFLKKYKSNIITADFLRNFNEEYIVCYMFSKSQVFYIIDLSEKKRGDIKIYRTFLLNYCPVSE